jgi:glycerol kinase
VKQGAILAIDQGTSGSKAVIFDTSGNLLAKSTVPTVSSFPRPGYVEQDPEELYSSVIGAVRSVMERFESAGGRRTEISCCGISNQRETFLLWDHQGRPLRPAVVWQCKRSVEVCSRLQKEGAGRELTERTGLIIDPYFSGTKLTAIMGQEPEIALRVREGKALFGTVDSWLLFRLTGGRIHATDLTNASRTLFMNLGSLEWDPEMIGMLSAEGLLLPEIRSSSGDFGTSSFEGLFPSEIPISAMIGDSHAAAFGERVFIPGSAKATLGTGSSILMNTGGKRPVSGRGMVSTICWSAGKRVDYALEGIIVSCGSTVTWMRDKLGLFSESRDADRLAESVPDSGGVTLVPAFAGLGAPYWRMEQKGLITGLTFGTGKAHLVRAGLESIAFQLKDVITAMEEDSGMKLSILQVDGGLTASSLVLDLTASLLTVPVTAIALQEASALGAALLAGLGSGIYSSIDEIAAIPYNSVKHMPEPVPAMSGARENWNRTIRNL